MMSKYFKIVVITVLGYVLISGTWNGRAVLTPWPFPVLEYFPPMPESKYNVVTMEGAVLGRYLFYDTLLSRNYAFSCASCHRQEVAFSDSPTQFSEGFNGQLQRRNTPPLFNLAWYATLFWDGRAASIEEQVFHPVREKGEMDLTWEEAEQRLNKNEFYVTSFKKVFGSGRIDSNMVSKAIGQFLRTLVSNNSKFDKVLRRETMLTEMEHDGFVLMNEQNKGNCLHCHTTDANALGTTGVFSNNGLDSLSDANDFDDRGLGEYSGKKEDNGKFKIPSLRNVALTAPYMHDGRFNSLEEVLDFYNEHVMESPTLDPKINPSSKLPLGLTKEEKVKIIAFL